MAFVAIVTQLLRQLLELNLSIGNYIYLFYIQYSRIILDAIHGLFQSSFRVFLWLTVALAAFYLLMALLLSLFKSAPKRTRTSVDEYPSVTVQIPTYNELAALNCARLVLENDYPEDRLQLIIGDDSNDKEISAKIDAFAEQNQGRVLVTRRGRNIGYKPGNLNHMLKYTKGEILVIFDSDFLPSKDFLKRIVAPLVRDRNVVAAQARWNIYNFDQNMISVLGGTISLLCHNIILEFINMFKGTGFLCGSAEAIRTDVVRGAGGWQAGSMTEDIECSLRLISQGERIVYLEDLSCDCEAPHTFKDLCRQQMRWAYGVISALKQHIIALLGSRAASMKNKLSVIVFTSGYLFSFLLLGITVAGILSVISARPAPVDWERFLSETAMNFLLTTGFLVASIVAMVRSRRIRALPRMMAASLSVGLAVTYYVNVGIVKAVFSRGMHWFMLKKRGNEAVA
jgi:cellulose synthase/poly-beta-1,6-N-acetylglucosamine synthase-like glycosyltransferase